MNRSDFEKLTPFDRLISSKQLQMLKLLIPYTPAKSQRMLAICTKLLELNYTIRFFQNCPPDIHTQAFEKNNFSPFDMLDELRPYLPEEEQNMMDSFFNMFNIMEMMSAMQSMTGDMQEFSDTEGFDPMNLMKGMLSPEQQETFEMYNSMFQENKQEADHDAESEDSERKGDENEWTTG